MSTVARTRATVVPDKGVVLIFDILWRSSPSGSRTVDDGRRRNRVRDVCAYLCALKKGGGRVPEKGGGWRSVAGGPPALFLVTRNTSNALTERRLFMS